MISNRGRPLSPETKRAVVSIKQYFDGKKLQPVEPSVKRAADALGIGIATVKKIVADYNRDPKLLDEPNRLRGRPIHAVSVTHQEEVRAYIRSANQRGKYITLSDIEGFLKKDQKKKCFIFRPWQGLSIDGDFNLARAHVHSI